MNFASPVSVAVETAACVDVCAARHVFNAARAMSMAPVAPEPLPHAPVPAAAPHVETPAL